MLVTCNTLPGDEIWVARPDFRHWAGVAIFRLPVAENRSFALQATTLLTADERLRAQRYHRAQDHDRFLLGRAALRLMLGAYLGQSPAGLHFKPGPNKKPWLREAPDLHYNVTHAGNWILLAVAPAEVGIDVERLDPAFTFQEVLDHSCSPAERSFINRSPVPYRAFYQLWTRKEALVKATAQGIDAEFSQVPALDGRYSVAGAGAEPEWLVSSFGVAADYVAAVAYPTALGGSLRFYEVGPELLSSLHEAAAH